MSEDGKENRPGKARGKPGAADRTARLGAALRANLQRRKAQARARRDGDGKTEPKER